MLCLRLPARRPQALYEVWLPHISEGAVTVQHSTRVDPCAAFFAAQRSTQGAGCFGSCWAALHYLCAQQGVGHPQLKQLSFWTRCHFLRLAANELALSSCSVNAHELRLLQWAVGRTAHSARKLLQAGKLSEQQLAQYLQPLLDQVLNGALCASRRHVDDLSSSSMQLLGANKSISAPTAAASRPAHDALATLHFDPLAQFQQPQYRWQPPLPSSDVQRRIAVPHDGLTLGWLPNDDSERPLDWEDLALWECRLLEDGLRFCESTRSVHIRPGKRCSDAAAAALGRLCWALEALFLRILPLPSAPLSEAHRRVATRNAGTGAAPSACATLFELSRHYIVCSLSLPSVSGHSGTHAHAGRVLTLAHIIVKHAALAGCGGAAAATASSLPAPWLGVMSRGAGDVVLPRMLECIPMTQEQSASHGRLMQHMSQCGYTMVSVEPPRLVADTPSAMQPPGPQESIFAGYLRSLEEAQQVMPTASGNNEAAWAKPTSLFNFGREGIYQRLDVESDATLLMAQRYVDAPLDESSRLPPALQGEQQPEPSASESSASEPSFQGFESGSPAELFKRGAIDDAHLLKFPSLLHCHGSPESPVKLVTKDGYGLVLVRAGEGKTHELLDGQVVHYLGVGRAEHALRVYMDEEGVVHWADWPCAATKLVQQQQQHAEGRDTDSTRATEADTAGARLSSPEMEGTAQGQTRCLVVQNGSLRENSQLVLCPLLPAGRGRQVQRFVLNADATLSPLNAPTLVWGCEREDLGELELQQEVARKRIQMQLLTACVLWVFGDCAEAPQMAQLRDMCAWLQLVLLPAPSVTGSPLGGVAGAHAASGVRTDGKPWPGGEKGKLLGLELLSLTWRTVDVQSVGQILAGQTGATGEMRVSPSSQLGDMLDDGDAARDGKRGQFQIYLRPQQLNSAACPSMWIRGLRVDKSDMEEEVMYTAVQHTRWYGQDVQNVRTCLRTQNLALWQPACDPSRSKPA